MTNGNPLQGTTDETRFAFGENWQRYSTLIDEARLAEAERALAALVPAEKIRGARFLDIGCGSGLHALAALRLGAREVLACDLDPRSVETTRGVIDRFAPQAPARAIVQSVFDLKPDQLGRFEVVYSWGVLHHTGDMWKAIDLAAAMTAPGGTFAFALYAKTPLCRPWRWEKRWYAGASPRAQARAMALFVFLYRLRFALAGRDFRRMTTEYHLQRGMDFRHDVHDWLGGYPYESVTAGEVEAFMHARGFERRLVNEQRIFGLFGSTCSEFVYTLPV